MTWSCTRNAGSLRTCPLVSSLAGRLASHSARNVEQELRNVLESCLASSRHAYPSDFKREGLGTSSCSATCLTAERALVHTHTFLPRSANQAIWATRSGAAARSDSSQSAYPNFAFLHVWELADPWLSGLYSGGVGNFGCVLTASGMECCSGRVSHLTFFPNRLGAILKRL